MSQSNKGMVVVLAGGCLLGLALGLGYLLYWTPMQRAKQARQEIDAWGAHWNETKACLLGPSPASGDVLEAMIARELSTTNWGVTLRGCTSHLKGLPREQGADTEEPPIEDAWYALRVPVGKLATAHAWRSAKKPSIDTLKLWTDLAHAIVLVDGKYDDLRAAAEMASQQKNSQRLASAGQVQSLETPEDQEAEVSNVALNAGLITYTATIEASSYLATLDESGASTFVAVSPLALRAADADWGLWVEHDGIPIHESLASQGDRVFAGPLDTFGEPAADGTLLHRVGKQEQLSLEFAVGEQTRVALFRRIVYSATEATWAHRLMASTNGGVTWTKHPLPDSEIFVALRRASHGSYIGRSATNDPSSMHWQWQQLGSDGVQTRTLEFEGDRLRAKNWPPELCQADSRAWWIVDGSVYTIGTDRKLRRLPTKLIQDTRNYDQRMTCSDESFAVTSRSYNPLYKDQLAVETCDTEKCITKPRRIPAPMAAGVFPLHHKGTYAVIVVMGEFAAVWTARSEQPRIVRLDADGEAVGGISRQDHIQLMLWPKTAKVPKLLQVL